VKLTLGSPRVEGISMIIKRENKKGGGKRGRNSGVSVRSGQQTKGTPQTPLSKGNLGKEGEYHHRRVGWRKSIVLN